MNDLIQKISKKIFNMCYNTNITNSIEKSNNYFNKKKDTVFISEKAKKLFRKEKRLQDIKKRIKNKNYITEEIIERTANSIAKSFMLPE